MVDSDKSNSSRLARRRHRPESRAGPPRVDSWFPRCSGLADLSLPQVFRSLWEHRSFHYWAAGLGARDRASDTAPSHSETTDLSVFRSPEFDGSSVASGSIGHDFVDSHVECDGLGHRGLHRRSHDLPTDSRTEHPPKVARDISSGSSRLRHRSRGATPRTPANFAYSVRHFEWCGVFG